MSEKKKGQLGMNPSTASARLIKDLLWDFIVSSGKDVCVKCGQKMTRQTFSIEHVVPWLDSEDPISTFFDTKNIAYSHMSCNFRDARKKTITEHSTVAMYAKGCRCDDCRNAKAKENSKRIFDPLVRKERYKKTGH